ncbi:hypothetical protein [Xanthomonas oryzae]|uniref:Uncharacterized protein n=1 Tax=Xanthomonas oryzae pv. oryzae TaxID=64187 RepID=A0AAJ5MCK8_XANOO|nr:hypothetical protein [Xanthomonas oryzae]MDI9912689.1 hypothetical protein [Xanthomonas oryzae pv. oryzae]QIF21312.1 hypothetical protein G6N84_02060 [Xanthomonas oryzae pv. oryzae]QUW74514.1 hypothetical protein KCI36_14995 [Xanthomonas oryzae]UEG96199.1 hypothetical protein LLC55_14745 [Xanthomonas oryzae pv. oryzae]UEQ21338.1 hypothetical protein KFK26_09665 [Xanthomonas oryzae]
MGAKRLVWQSPGARLRGIAITIAHYLRNSSARRLGTITQAHVIARQHVFAVEDVFRRHCGGGVYAIIANDRAGENARCAMAMPHTCGRWQRGQRARPIVARKQMHRTRRAALRGQSMAALDINRWRNKQAPR